MERRRCECGKIAQRDCTECKTSQCAWCADEEKTRTYYQFQADLPPEYGGEVQRAEASRAWNTLEASRAWNTSEASRAWNTVTEGCASCRLAEAWRVVRHATPSLPDDPLELVLHKFAGKYHAYRLDLGELTPAQFLQRLADRYRETGAAGQTVPAGTPGRGGYYVDRPTWWQRLLGPPPTGPPSWPVPAGPLYWESDVDGDHHRVVSTAWLTTDGRLLTLAGVIHPRYMVRRRRSSPAYGPPYAPSNAVYSHDKRPPVAVRARDLGRPKLVEVPISTDPNRDEPCDRLWFLLTHAREDGLGGGVPSISAASRPF